MYEIDFTSITREEDINEFTDNRPVTFTFIDLEHRMLPFDLTFTYYLNKELIKNLYNCYINEELFDFNIYEKISNLCIEEEDIGIKPDYLPNFEHYKDLLVVPKKKRY